ncbi:MAG TPA: MFS transporter [Verrucomicrobiae bacterium]|jgi:MFS family permease|nr:MFS transporter [Verrucomicrobiae bacterium]
MSDTTGTPSAPTYRGETAGSGNIHAHRLLWAGFMAILAEGMGFGLRGGILGQWANQYGFTMTDLGTITGGGLTGFGVVVILSSLIADKVGYGRLMVTAFVLHFTSAVVTLAAGPAFAAGGKHAAFLCLFWGMFLFAIGNGLCEAVANPLVASLFRKSKSKYLNILHAGWPAGLVLGGLSSYFLSSAANPVAWQIQISLFLVPTVIYGVMLLGQKFPKSEALEHGVRYKDMLREVGMLGAFVVCLLLSLWLKDTAETLGLPGFMGFVGGGVLFLIFGACTGFSMGYPLMFVLLIIHGLQGYTELGTDSWVSKITGAFLAKPEYGLLLFVYISSLMFALRFFAGPIVHKISALGLLFASTVLASLGLLLLGYSSSAMVCIAAATVYAVGKTFMWPTLLAVASERFPKGGAITIGAMGGVGMLSAGLLGGPGIGFNQDSHAAKQMVAENPAVYQRYKADAPNTFLFFSTTGLDGSKVAALDDNGEELARRVAASEGKDQSAVKLNAWWQEAKLTAAADKPIVTDAMLHGSKMALRITSALPAVQAVLLIGILLYFRSQGGYKQVHIEGEGAAAKEVV